MSSHSRSRSHSYISYPSPYHALPSPPPIPGYSQYTPYRSPNILPIPPPVEPSFSPSLPTPPRTPKLPPLSLAIPPSFSPPPARIPSPTVAVPAALQIIPPTASTRPRSVSSCNSVYRRPKSYVAYSQQIRAEDSDEARPGRSRQSLPVPPTGNSGQRSSSSSGGYVPFRAIGSRAVSMGPLLERTAADWAQGQGWNDNTPNPITGRRIRVAGGLRSASSSSSSETDCDTPPTRPPPPPPTMVGGVATPKTPKERTTAALEKWGVEEKGVKREYITSALKMDTYSGEEEEKKEREAAVVVEVVEVGESGVSSPATGSLRSPTRPVEILPAESMKSDVPETPSTRLLADTIEADIARLLSSLPCSSPVSSKSRRPVSAPSIERVDTFGSVYSNDGEEDWEDVSPSQRPGSWSGGAAETPVTPFLWKVIRSGMREGEGGEWREGEQRRGEEEEGTWEDDIAIVMDGMIRRGTGWKALEVKMEALGVEEKAKEEGTGKDLGISEVRAEGYRSVVGEMVATPVETTVGK